MNGALRGLRRAPYADGVRGSHRLPPASLGIGSRNLGLFSVGVGLVAGGIADLGSDQSGIGADRRLDGLRNIGIRAQEILGVFTALSDPLAIIGIPGTRFLDDAGGGAEIEQFADLGDALAIHDVEF